MRPRDHWHKQRRNRCHKRLDNAATAYEAAFLMVSHTISLCYGTAKPRQVAWRMAKVLNERLLVRVGTLCSSLRDYWCFGCIEEVLFGWQVIICYPLALIQT
jgi:hypothetical protein